MESQPQNPEFRNNPENVHPCKRGQFQIILHRSHGIIIVRLCGDCIQHLLTNCSTIMLEQFTTAGRFMTFN